MGAKDNRWSSKHLSFDYVTTFPFDKIFDAM